MEFYVFSQTQYKNYSSGLGFLKSIFFDYRMIIFLYI